MMKRLATAAALFLFAAASAFAACTTSVPAGSIQVVDCNQESVVADSPYYSITDVNALPLGFWFAWSNASTQLATGIVSGQITFTSGNPVLSWPNHGLAAGSYLVLTNTFPGLSNPGTLPSNFTASTLSAQTVYFVIAAGLTTDAFELSATPGGTAITPSGNGFAWGFNLVAGFSAWANTMIASVRAQQQQAATQQNAPTQITLTPAQ